MADAAVWSIAEESGRISVGGFRCVVGEVTDDDSNRISSSWEEEKRALFCRDVDVVGRVWMKPRGEFRKAVLECKKRKREILLVVVIIVIVLLVV